MLGFGQVAKKRVDIGGPQGAVVYHYVVVHVEANLGEGPRKHRCSDYGRCLLRTGPDSLLPEREAQTKDIALHRLQHQQQAA